jgi:uncharacterized protein YbjT (DUF2867 family)
MSEEDPTTTDTAADASTDDDTPTNDDTPTDDDTPTVLVTAGTGTVGRHVVAALADELVDLRVASRDPDRARETLTADEHVEMDESALDGTASAVEFVAFDLDRPETYYPTLSGVDRLFLVRPPAVSRVERDLFPFVDAAVRMGVEHVVFLSVLGAEKNPLLPHRRVESHLADLPVTTTFLRASFFCQNLLTTHRAEVRQGEIAVPAGDGETSFVDARDVAAVAARALADPTSHRDRAYDVTGPEALTYEAFAEVLSAALDFPVRYTNPSLLRFVWRRLRAGDDFGFALVTAGIYTTARLGLAGRVSDDVETVLGRQPRTIGAFAADYADEFRTDE